MAQSNDIILTGIRPTGSLHIGHMVGALIPNIEIQNAGGYKKMYAMIADAQGLTDNFDNPERVRENVMEVALDMLATACNRHQIHIVKRQFGQF